MNPRTSPPLPQTPPTLRFLLPVPLKVSEEGDDLVSVIVQHRPCTFFRGASLQLCRKPSDALMVVRP
ncbi:hypothetical protein Taro_032225 [Colocasia esculenta]|uniref:Uncharacterized protein n=1 Tax=Colocasia esculenta TaxID=4460 RepID=A0A843W395_COLES|nr:hypothetical protein [Colocasia esculenta]